MKRWLSNVLLVVFGLVFLISAYFLLDYILESRRSQGQFDELAELVSQQTTAAVDDGPIDPEETTEGAEPQLVAVEDPQTGQTVWVLPEYAELYKLNNDLVGWIRIEDTVVNYPVVQRPEETDYYLHRDFYGEESTHGCIYVREQCDVVTPSDNVVIYGHRMRDGSMFRSLLSYQERDYYEAHKYIRFDTLTEHHTYEVMAVFLTTATWEGYDYHLFVDAADQADFDRYVADVKQLALYDTGVSAEYGDKLITLSTCEWSQEQGRLVVVAKRVN